MCHNEIQLIPPKFSQSSNDTPLSTVNFLQPSSLPPSPPPPLHFTLRQDAYTNGRVLSRVHSYFSPVERREKGGRQKERKRERDGEGGGGQSGKENHFRHDAWESEGSQIRHLQFDIKRKVASFTSKWKSTIGIEKYINST